jgi:hypothetical protein
MVFKILCLALPFAAGQTLILSEYLQSSSQGNAIEIFNTGCATVTLSDYYIKVAPGGGAWGTGFQLSGTLSQLSAKSICFSNTFCSINANTLTIDGTDAVGLFENNVLIDYIGYPGEYLQSTFDVAGTVGASRGYSLTRNAHVNSGTGGVRNFRDPLADRYVNNVYSSQWIVSSASRQNLDAHTYTGSSCPSSITRITCGTKGSQSPLRSASGAYWQIECPLDCLLTASSSGTIVGGAANKFDASSPVRLLIFIYFDHLDTLHHPLGLLGRCSCRPRAALASERSHWA